MKTFRNFKDILKEYLHDNGLTQAEFARITETSAKQIHLWIKGNSTPNYDSLKKMSKLLDVSADYLLGLSDYY